MLLYTAFILALIVGGLIVFTALAFFVIGSSIFAILLILSGVIASPLSALFVLGIYTKSSKTWVSTNEKVFFV